MASRPRRAVNKSPAHASTAPIGESNPGLRGEGYALLYTPTGRKLDVQLDKLGFAKASASWFDPHDGKASAIGTFENKGVREFTPPDHGEMLDWVLVLEDASRPYPAPGTSTSNRP